MTNDTKTQDPTAESTREGQITGGNRGALSGRDDDQRRAIGQDDPLTEGSRQGRERHKDSLEGDAPCDSDKAV